MKADSPVCFAAITLVGISLAGCQSVSPQFSSSFDNASQNGLSAQAGLAIPLLAPDAQPAVESLGLAGLTSATGATAEPVEINSFFHSNGVPGDVVPQILDAGHHLECVPFARAESGIEIRGNANRWWQLAAGKYHRTRHPSEGAVLVMKGYETNRRGHVAVVKRIIDDRTIVVDHANWGNDGRIYRQAPVRDLSPKNDWSEVQVWHTPSKAWGRRVYKGRGFILPTTAVASISTGRAMTLVGGVN